MAKASATAAQIYLGISAEGGSTIQDAQQYVRIYPTLPDASGIQAPPLPGHFVERPETLDPVIDFLTAASGQGELPVALIHGMGGSGKSTLAAAVAANPRITARFPDGVLWAEMKPGVEPRSLLEGWLQELNDYVYRVGDIGSVTARLRSLLHDRSMLLVIDGAWEPESTNAFLAGGPQCAVLITSRRADLGGDLGPRIFPVGELSEEQSLALMERRIGRSLEAERAEALAVAVAVGHLPLALELVAARRAKGVSWGEIRSPLEGDHPQLQSIEGPRQRRLELCLNRSIQAIKEFDVRAWEAFCWLGAVTEGAAITVPMCIAVWNMGATDAARTLDLLENDALLSRGYPVRAGREVVSSWRIHSLLRDAALHLLTSQEIGQRRFTVAEAHGELVGRYPAALNELSNDGYIHSHLLYHLEKAGKTARIHEVLKETSGGNNTWFAIRDSLGELRGYIEDVLRAWRLAEEESSRRSSDEEYSRNELLYALVLCSVRNLAANVTPSLLKRLIESGTWTPQQALEYSRQNGMAGLAEIAPLLPEALRFDALQSAVAQKNDMQVAGVAMAIAPWASKELVSASLLAASRMHDEQAAFAVVFAFMSRLDPEHRANILAKFDSLPEIFRILIMPALVKYFPTHEKRRRIRFLFEELDRPEIARQWMDAVVEDVHAELTSPQMLAALQRFFAQRQKMWAGLYKVKPENDVTAMSQDAFIRWLRRLDWSDDMATSGFASYFTLQNLSKRAPLFTRLLMGALGGETQRIHRWFLDVEARHREGASCADLLFVQYLDYLAPEIDATLSPWVEERCQRITGTEARLESLTILIARVGGKNVAGLATQAAALIRTIQNPSDRIRYLVPLKDRLPEDLFRQSLCDLDQACQNLQDSGRGKWVESLVALAGAVPRSMLGAVLQRLEALEDVTEKVQGLSKALERAGQGSVRDDLLKAARAAVDSITNREERVRAWAQLAKWLSPEEVSRFLQDLLLPGTALNKEAFGELTPLWPDNLLGEAVKYARAIDDSDQSAEALERFPSALAQSGKIDAAIKIARAISDPLISAMTLLRIAAREPASLGSGDGKRTALVREALERAATVAQGYLRLRDAQGPESFSTVRLAAAELLEGEEKKRLIAKVVADETEEIPNDGNEHGPRTFSIKVGGGSMSHEGGGVARHPVILLDAITALARMGYVQEAENAASKLESKDRWAGRSRIAEQCSPANAPDYWRIALDAVAAIEDVRLPVGSDPAGARDDAFKWLLPYAYAALGDRVMPFVEQIVSVRDRCEALIGISRRAKEPARTVLRSSAVQLAAKLSAADRVSILASLDQDLTDSAERNQIKQAALQAIYSIDDDQQCVRAAMKIVSWLDRDELARISAMASDIQDQQERDWSLTNLVTPTAKLVGQGEAMDLLRSIDYPAYRSRAAAVLMPLLDEEGQKQALAEIAKPNPGGLTRNDIIFDGSGSKTMSTLGLSSQCADLRTAVISIRPALRSELRRTYQAVLRQLSEASRSSFFLAIPDLCEVIKAIDGATGLSAAVDGIQNVCRWWP